MDLLRRWATAVLVTVLLVVAHAPGQIPSGFEIIQITDDPAEDRYVQMNNCGEVVYRKYIYGGFDIFRYDNGITIRVTEDGLFNSTPDINDYATMVWSHKVDIDAPRQIVLYEDGVITELTDHPCDDQVPRINNIGHVVWQRWFGDGCVDSRAEIMFYDGDTMHQITDDEFSSQSGVINDSDDIVWTQYNFCVDPWESEIMLYVDELTTPLPTDQMCPQIPTINNSLQVGWGGSGGIEVWEDAQTTLITDWGRNPAMNDHGDIFFLRWHEDMEAWQASLYLNGNFYQLSDDSFWNTDGDINDYGEAGWEMGEWGHRDVRLLRRIRTGDVDFDFDVDAEDFAAFPACMTGPFDTDRLCECRFLDLDHDRDVDLADFAIFQNAFGSVFVYDDHNCCQPHYDPGCTDPEIAACVCELMPYCCETTWDEVCAFAVEMFGCGECP